MPSTSTGLAEEIAAPDETAVTAEFIPALTRHGSHLELRVPRVRPAVR